eukprot:CAMPEP_0184711982 /NCGR_PEP_ID=MMETSP0314-20130426/2605_1 /TAXON_ID=38298 /ORGANISM="Rhodella maculata, Strain CCMP 736" /LENGTH=97 /DNA_ID=CAMNT_0027174301 /DNA_START=19 /DNA_END=312 /DNA_ORIENTATION=-
MSPSTPQSPHAPSPVPSSSAAPPAADLGALASGSSLFEQRAQAILERLESGAELAQPERQGLERSLTRLRAVIRRRGGAREPSDERRESKGGSLVSL